MTKPPCITCKFPIQKGPAYSVPKGYLCEMHWTKELKQAELEIKNSK